MLPYGRSLAKNMQHTAALFMWTTKRGRKKEPTYTKSRDNSGSEELEYDTKEIFVNEVILRWSLFRLIW